MKRYIKSASELQKKYSGVWFGGRKSPMTIKELLDKIIDTGGRAFYLKTKRKFVSNNLMDEPVTEVILTTEEGVGSLKLGQDALQYLYENLPTTSYLRGQCEQYLYS